MNETALQIIGHPRFINDEERFTKTFEWYVGEAMVRYFSGFSFAFGVHIKYVRHNQNDRPAGDYDALVVMRNLELLYFECKTGGFKRYKILNAIQNAISLNCDFLVMAAASLDPQRLANTVAEMQHPLLAEHIRFDLAKIQIKNTSTTIYEWHNCYFISASDDFIEQMQAVLRFNEAKRVARHYFMGPSDTEISMMGYQVERIKPEVTP
mgnify:CR=1 FL=1